MVPPPAISDQESPLEASTTLDDQRLRQLLEHCPDPAKAAIELRRLSEHAFDTKTHHNSQQSPDARLTGLVDRRAKGEPLEYIIGSTQWGGLDILCRSGTLIPRESSEIVVSKLARTLTQLQSEGIIEPEVPLKIADIGTGSGCTSLFLHASLHQPHATGQNPQSLEILGGDVSPDCLELASDNLPHNVTLQRLDPSARADISFQHLDMIKLGEAAAMQLDDDNIDTDGVGSTTDSSSRSFLHHKWNVLTSYPPCVPSVDFLPGGRVPYTDRAYQPKLAIVPPTLANKAMAKLEIDPADVFFYILLIVALKAEINLTVLEVCEGPQATRVWKMAAQLVPKAAWIERWRDDTVFSGEDGLAGSDAFDQNDDEVHGRAVVVWLGEWAQWRRAAAETS